LSIRIRTHIPGNPVRATVVAVLRRLALAVDIVDIVDTVDTVPFGPEAAPRVQVADSLPAVRVRLAVHRKQEAQTVDLAVANVQQSSLQT
jgi:hypothetical protein